MFAALVGMNQTYFSFVIPLLRNIRRSKRKVKRHIQINTNGWHECKRLSFANEWRLNILFDIELNGSICFSRNESLQTYRKTCLMRSNEWFFHHLQSTFHGHTHTQLNNSISCEVIFVYA